MSVESKNEEVNIDELRIQLSDIDKKIEEYQKLIDQLEAKKFFFQKKDLKEMKKELEELFSEHSVLVGKIIEIERQERLELKRHLCQDLLEKLSNKKTVENENGEIIENSDEVINAFKEEVAAYKDSEQLTQEYDRIETSDYIITEELVVNGNNIDIRVTTNDLPIAAKHHQHISSLDEMIVRYKNHLDNNKEKSM